MSMPPLHSEESAHKPRGGKAYRRGAHLLVDPVETLSKVVPLMAQMGITRIANVTGLDRIGIPVVMVCRPNSRSIAVSQGKGLTLNAAKASGVMESVESWHAERIELPLKLGSFADLSGNHAFIDIERLPAMRGSRYQQGLPILWIESVNLFDDARFWLPYESVHTFYAHPAPAGSGCFSQSSNGLASGNHYLEAVAHAVCECVERDASSLWHHHSKALRDETKLDLDTIDDECCVELLAKLARADLVVTLWDTTSDTGIPCFECVVLDDTQADVHPGQGAGCHPSKSIALVRAITEAVQVRTTYIAGSRDDLTHAEFAAEELAQRNHSFRDLVGSAPGKVDFRQLETHEFDSFEQDVDWLLQRLSAVGIDQVLCVDLSKVAIDIPVVRVVVPGLEGPHDDDDYIPGPRAQATIKGGP
jgi:YcaO-like protein with predicted kinase domain